MSFPPHDPNYPDVDPATGDERATELDPATLFGSVAQGATVRRMANVYEIIVERKLRDRFLVAARSSAEAAAAVGANLSSDAAFSISETTEVGRRMHNPRRVPGGTVDQVRDFEADQRGAGTPPDSE